jgi:poly(A) polymerase
MRALLAEQQQHTTSPRRLTTFMQETWTLQSRLQRGARRADKLIAHPRFRAAYDFLVLRESVGEATDGMGAWWTTYQEDHETPVPSYAPREERRPRRRRRRRPAKPATP